MFQIELMGGPRCGDRVFLNRETLPSRHHVLIVQQYEGGATRTLEFNYVPSAYPARDGAHVYAFEGYRDGVATRA